jgi:hypothetical protein
MIVSVALAFLAASAAPADAAASAQPAPAAKPVKEKKICRTDEATTGSVMRSKTCRTKAEWDALAARELGTGTVRHSSAPTIAGNGN